ncbi:hypothetical protein C8R44DRAFT_728259 [Mycena epipterygia]|nr:hypothetical protein C8R44DRAFT_728259 [Mycena epipterygia]
MLCASCKHPLPPSDALPNSTQTEELQTLLRAWHFPLNTAHYQSQFASSTAALAQYDSEIERLEETLQAMLADRLPERRVIHPTVAIGDLMRDFHGILLVLSGITQLRGEKKNISNSDLLLVSHVCAQWRTLALGTPRLWSDIAAVLYYWPTDPTPFLHLLRTSLERGAGHPLTFSLDTMTGDGYFPHVAFYPVLELLAEHSPRWQFVTLRLDVAALTAIRNVQERLGSLEKLSLTLLDSDGVANNTGTTIFRNAPRLTYVRINIPNPRSCPQLPWKQLRSFTFDGGNVDTMVSIQNLSGAFEFRGGLYYIGIPFDLPPITSAISSFLLEVGDGCLTLPHLRELYFVRPEDSYSSHTVFWPVSQFEALSLRSSFRDTLRVLEIPHVTITADDLVRSLASLGSLERLVISDQRAMMQSPAHIWS